MAAIDDLDREVRRLRKRANELENTQARRAESELAELIGNNDETPTQRRGFARALKARPPSPPGNCVRRAVSWKALVAREQEAFRRAYSAVPGDDLSAALPGVRRVGRQSRAKATPTSKH